MTHSCSRRRFLAAGLVVPLLALPACTTLGDYAGLGLEDAVRRLLTVSSQRAFSNLLQGNGFFRDELARVTLPAQLGGSGATSVVAALLQSQGVQSQLLSLVNDAAGAAAENAAPLLYDSIRSMSITDALAIMRGGPTAATDYLERQIGERVVDALFPQVGTSLRLLDNGMLSRVLSSATGIDFAGLQQDVTRKTAQGIWRAVGREEAAIRADPTRAGDPALSAALAIAR